MDFSKVLGKKDNYKNKILILYKINRGYFEKKNFFKLNSILLLKKLNLINFHVNINKYNILLRKKEKYYFNYDYFKIFLKYFENKPIYIF